MEFLSEESEFSKKSREEEDPNAIGKSFVLWVVAIMVLIGLNAFSWIFCMYVFGQPEEPFNYKVLTKLDKLPPLKGFRATTVPRGKFHTVKEIYGTVYNYTDVQLANYNDIKKRHYLKNYHERSDVTFLGGEFIVQNIRRLNDGDVFPRGFAIRARSESFPDGLIDFVIPAGSDNDFKEVPGDVEGETKLIPLDPPELPEGLFVAGEPLIIEESETCAALLHIDRKREKDGEISEMVFTVVPLVNREFASVGGGVVTSRPPQRLNLSARNWPLSDGDLVSNPIAPKDKPEGEDDENAEEDGEKVASTVKN